MVTVDIAPGLVICYPVVVVIHHCIYVLCMTEIPVPTPTATECLCEPSSAPTEMHETTLIRTISLGPSSSSVAPEVPPTKPVENTTTVVLFTTTVEPGPGKDAPVTAIHPEGNGKEGNDIPNGSGNSANDPDSNHIGAESEASIGNQSNTQQLLVILVIAGWALFLICLPVIIFLIVSNRSKVKMTRHPISAVNTEFPPSTPKQKIDGENQVNHLHLNGHSTYHHLSPQVSLQESSTGQPPSSVEQSRSHTPSKAATLERGTPQGASRTQSLSRAKPTGPPPVPPKRTSSVLSHNGPRCPPIAYTKGPQRGSNPTTPTKKRLNSSSSSDSSDREPPPYRPLSGGSEDDRRRRPSGASNHEVQPEFDPGWYQNQVRSHEQSV
ncbi:uncharacterized protein [Apostichopus japonicus]|uniref:uncharacterized protein isoform X2 n=1 Tax=Stichopus japonicus TaxID=307972 RepID=UPI003AB85A3E